MGASASKEMNSSSQQVVNTSTDAASVEQQQEAAAAAQSRCPVPEGYRNPAIYNVYSQRINDPAAQQSCPSPLSALQGTDLLDPKNNMPLEANQQPCPGQRKPLSIERVQSTIPKGGTDTTWLYPSPQMFFNGEFTAC
jgi:cytochrome c heme-lyase